ncbi:MAG: bifunctional phosphoribosylaminoimidazolecarboxamide formyltransferase/IMP cyclohydrolase, partial [Alphaproteobacteria bacterium]
MSGPGDRVAIRRALLSVADKTGLADLARALAARNVALLSTGSTAAMLRQAGLAVTEVADITGVPEMMDGRVKTLHPRIHGGLLARRDADSHNAAMAEHGIPAIDLLVSNLYPFEQRLADGAGFDAQVEEIDIGGPAMTRSAAKNHDFVTVLSDPAQYDSFLSEFSAHDGATSLHFRRRMAQAAFARTAAYDSLIQAWLARQIGDQSAAPRHLVSAGRLVQTLRYGENPHQTGALYADPLSRGPAIATARQVQGRELSWNNIADADAAFQLAAEFARHHQAACTIVKHANPSGVALADSSAAAYLAARAADPDSAYGGIIAFSRPLDEAAARAVTSLFAEVVVAPAADDAACAVLAAKPNLRLLLTGPWPPAGAV